MPPNLYLSSRTSTALAHLVSQIQQDKSGDVLHPITVLVPSAGIIQDLQGYLGDFMNIQLVQFYRLGHAILNEANLAVQEINDTAIRWLIRKIIRELREEGGLAHFDRVWDKPGFIEVILNWLREMKSQGIFPEDYSEYALKAEDGKDRELAQIYTRYQAFLLENNYSDPDGSLWVVAEALEDEPELYRKQGSLYVFGFDQFTPIQVRILQQLAGKYPSLNIYLPWDEDRVEDNLAIARLRRTRDQLSEYLSLEAHWLAGVDEGASILETIHKRVFQPGMEQVADDGHLRFVEAPDRETEVRNALRNAKRMLLEGVPPSSISILVPQKSQYQSIVQTVSSEYGVPVEFETLLSSNPAVAALIKVLQLPFEFERAATFDVLHSPYIQQEWLTEDQISTLDRLTRERPVIAGRDQWVFALKPFHHADVEVEDEDRTAGSMLGKMSADEIADLESSLSGFFDQLTPPEAAAVPEYVWWMQTNIIGNFPDEAADDDQPEAVPTLDWLECCRTGPFPGRDVQAAVSVLSCLRRLLAAHQTIPDGELITWEVFREEVLALLQVSQVQVDQQQARIRFDQLEGGRGRVVDHLFVLGLSEGEFPTPLPIDAIYSQDERENHPLPLIRYSPADEASLWWQVIGNVQEQLILSRPYIDENGAPWEASPYWEAVQDCIEGAQVERVAIAEHPLLEEAASQTELLVALARGGAKKYPGEFDRQREYIDYALSIIQQRDSYQTLNEFEGVIRSPALRAEIKSHYGPQHTWSASRLNRYVNCAYGFFVEQVLALSALLDPEEGMDVMQRGSLLHSILEDLYLILAETGTAPVTKNLENIYGYLDEVSEQIFRTAPLRYGFRPSALWEYEKDELRRLVRALVEWECETNDPQDRFIPYLQEFKFGIGNGGYPPLEITQDGIHFRLRGVIDRIDRDGSGHLRVIDYKSGSTRYSKNDLAKGFAMQTALYALAAEQFLLSGNGRVAESHYWHIPSRESSGSLEFSGEVMEDDLAQAVVAKAAESVSRVRSGVFPSSPAKPVQWGKSCAQQCDFSAICRVSRQSINKTSREGLR